jgi:HD-like signal output (HDOD) protein
MEDTKELEAQVVDLIRRDAVNVPPYPAVAMRLQRLASSDDFGASDIHRVISGDPVLAATVLRYANSAAFRGITPTSTLETAVSRIGTNEVCKIALATSIGAHAIVTGCLSSLRRRYWRLSMTSAMLCRSLAIARKQNPEEAFICGLLHDFGQVIATACFEEVLSKSRDTRVLPESVWADCVDRFHVELGLVTAVRWNLPPLIFSIISSHHNPKTDPSHKDLLDLILVCDAIALHLDRTPSPTVESLSTIPNLLPDEPARLINIIPSIASAVASLDETTPGKTTGFFQVRNHIQAPLTSLSGPNKPLSIKLQVIKSNGNTTYDTVYMAKDGLGFIGQGKLRENSMVRLRLEIPNSPIEVWAVISPCSAEGSPMHMEAKLFAADPALLKAWTNYYLSLE